MRGHEAASFAGLEVDDQLELGGLFLRDGGPSAW
jgi:hypothetical protein